MIEKNSLKINIVGDFCSKNVSNLKFGRKLDLRLNNGSLKFEITAKRLYAASQRVL